MCVIALGSRGRIAATAPVPERPLPHGQGTFFPGLLLLTGFTLCERFRLFPSHAWRTYCLQSFIDETREMMRKPPKVRFVVV